MKLVGIKAGRHGRHRDQRNTLPAMLFMVVEHFKEGDLDHVGERFKRCGRLLPEGVRYVASWMEATGAGCYQLMEAPDRAALDIWIGRWSDLVGFKVEEVLVSADFWSKREQGG